MVYLIDAFICSSVGFFLNTNCMWHVLMTHGTKALSLGSGEFTAGKGDTCISSVQLDKCFLSQASRMCNSKSRGGASNPLSGERRI